MPGGDLPTASGEQNGEQIQPPIIQGIQLPTGLNLAAKDKAVNWKVYKQQWANYSIAAQLAKQTKSTEWHYFSTR